MNRIKQLREDAGFLQKDFSELLHVKPNTVSSWERGRTEPDFDSIQKMAKIFEVSTDYLLGFAANPGPTADFDSVQLDITSLNEENRAKAEEYVEMLLHWQNRGMRR